MTQFYTTPRCCPTRASVLTGLYSHQADIGNMMEDRGVPGYRGELAKNALTIAEQLKRAGYATSAVGKWHVAHILFDGKRQLDFISDKPFWDNKDNWPRQRGFDRYFGTIHGVNSYYDPFSLVDDNTPVDAPNVRKNFYYTDVLTDCAIEDINLLAAGARGGDKPFFMYLTYTAPHWPLQAPEAVIAKYRERYLAGWDKIRDARYARQIESGLIDKNWEMSPRDSRVKAWDDTDQHKWEANRMAVHAAMIEVMDTGIGRVMDALKTNNLDQNTLVIFISDNGACDERIQPGFYDVPSRLRDGTRVRVGNDDKTVMAGPEDTWQSYGIAWANASNTPLTLYKHYCHEGGISTPFIAHWPAGIKNPGSVTNQLGHIIDIMATCVDVSGAKHPDTFKGRKIQPLEGRSLVPVFRGETRPQDFPLFFEHEGNRAVRLGDWKLTARNNEKWELHNIRLDRSEQHNLAAKHPEKVAEMRKLYEAWAKRANVLLRSELPPVVGKAGKAGKKGPKGKKAGGPAPD
jgi:arylsulfatase